MTDIARLGLRVDSTEVQQADTALDRFSATARRAAAAAKAFAAALALQQAADELIRVQRAFDKLNASLITATGSASNAAKAFGILQTFAANTPYALQEVTEAFIQLRNLGLTPSERALASYGNTAGAMGKGLKQMVEAVADAATGEFERLKEFGIKSAVEGDKVAFTFQGTTTKVKNSAKEIEEYLIRLGETKFAGGMELQAKTLDGAISALADSWDAFLLAVSQSGFGDATQAGVMGLSAALADMTTILKSVTEAADAEGKVIKENGIVHTTLAEAMRILVIAGMSSALTFRTLGRDVGAYFASAAAAVTGNYKGIAAIMKANKEANDQDMQLTAARIDKVRWAEAIAAKVAQNEAERKKREGEDSLALFGITSKTEDKKSKEAEAAAKKMEEAYQKIKEATEDRISELRLELQAGDKLTEGQKQALKVMEDLRTGVLKLNAAKTRKLALDLEEVIQLERAKTAQQNDAAAKAEAIKTQRDLVEGIVKSAAAVNLEADMFGKSAGDVTRATIAAIDWSKVTEEQTVEVMAQVAALNLLAEAQDRLDKKKKESVDVTRAKELLDILTAIDTATKQAAAGMESSFGRVGAAIGGLTTALSGYAVQQQAIAAQLAQVRADPASTADKIKKAEIAASKASAQAQIKNYGDLASAAKGFFKENSTGYKVMQTTEKAFRAYEMAMAIKNMLEKSGLLTAFTSLFVASKATETAAVVGQVPVVVAAEGAKQGAFSISALAAALTLPPPASFAAFAATAALLAAIGVAVAGGGGGGGMSAAQRQETQGTGSVLGDSKAKSDSIARSLELVADNSDIELNYTRGMLDSLRSIESSLSGLGSLLVRSGLSGDTAVDVKGSAQATFDKVFAPGSLGEKITGGLLGKVVGSIFGGKISTLDTGVTANKGTLGSIAAGGLTASQYTDTKKDGGWFSSDKFSTQMAGLGAEANDQFTKVIVGLANTITEAGKLLGLGGDEFTTRLNSFVVDIGKISLKGLTGEEIQKELEAVFSKLGDDMAQFAVGGLAGFQQVGEGHFETLSRIASNYANLDSILAASGATFGQVGMGSIAARERLIQMAGGIDELASKSSAFNDEFLTEAERLAPVQKYVTDQLAALGYAGLTTRDQFKDAVLGLANSGALATEAGAKTYTGLLNIAGAFAQVTEATKDSTLSVQAIADQRQGLQDRLDEAIMTSAQLAEKAANAIDKSNAELYNSVIAAEAKKQADIDAKAAADALKATNDVFLKQLLEIDKLTMTAEEVRAIEIDGMDETTIKLYDLLAARKAEQKAIADQKAEQEALTAAIKAANASQASLRASFMTDEQKLAEAQGKLTSGFKALGQDIPKTAGEFLKLAESADTSTQGGRDLIAALETLAPFFKTVQDAAAAAATKAAETAAQIKAQAEKDAADAKEAAKQEASDLLGIWGEYYELVGDDANAALVLEKQRAAAILEMTPAVAAANKVLWDAQDAAKAAAKAEEKRNKALADSNAVLDLQAQMYAVQGNAAGAALILSLQRAAELARIYAESPAVAQATLDLWNAQDAAKAASDQLSNAEAILAILGATYEAQGNQAALLTIREQQRMIALSKLTPELQALTKAQWDAEDAAAALTKATEAEAEAAQKAASIAEERAGLELRIAGLLGNTTLAREREMAALDESNRGLLLRAYALEDADQAVSTALDALQRAVEAEKASIQSAADTRIEAIRASMDANSTAIEAAQQQAQELGGIFDTIAGAVKTLRGDVASQAGSMASARSFIDMSLALAQSGGMPDAGKLADAINTVTQDKRESYGSTLDFKFAQLVQAGKLEALGKLAGAQKSVAEQQLEKLNDANELAQKEIAAIEAATAAQIKVLDGQLKVTQDAVSVMRGADLSIQSVGAAVAAVNATLVTLAAVRGTTPTTPTTPGAPDAPIKGWDGGMVPPAGSAGMPAGSGSLNTDGLSTAQQAYFNYLSQSAQAADADTLAYVKQLQDIQAWKSLENVIGIKGDPTESSDSYMARQGYAGLLGWASMPKFAAGGNHFGGVRMVGENGPELEATGASRIWSFDQTRDMLAGGGDGAVYMLVDEIKEQNTVLKEQNEKLEKRMAAIETNTFKAQDILDRWTGGGLSPIPTNIVKSIPLATV